MFRNVVFCLFLPAFCISGAACATTDNILPVAGNALTYARDAYTAICDPALFDALKQVEAVLCQVEEEPVRELCAEVSKLIHNAGSVSADACSEARSKLNVAIEIYTSINDLAAQ